MDFSQALLALKDGHMLSRKYWDGRNLYIQIYQNDTAPRGPYIALFQEGIKICAWIPLQVDILTDDWVFVRDLGVSNPFSEAA